jgi:triacylglycerol lipase
MTVFVEIPPDQHSATAFANFNATLTDLNLGNARALMWMSQLAYETGKQPTIDAVAPRWGFTSVAPFARKKTAIVGSFDTTGLLGERGDAIVLVFAGTDPGVWQTVATDGQARLSPATNTHVGFQDALDAARGVIQEAVTKSQQTGKPLWIAGHSLGAALAALAAQFADSLHRAPKAVYLFGMPRAGGATFQAAYNGNANLGPVSYRFVHGIDVVPRVPPAAIGYRHIGSVLQCVSGQKFDPAASALSPLGSDEPLAAADVQALQSDVLALLSRLAATPFDPAILGQLRNLLPGLTLSPPGPGLLGPFFVGLPQPIRDHLQDRYWTALTPAG